MGQLLKIGVTLSLLVVLYSVTTLQQQGGEQCWESWWKCTVHSAYGTNTRWEACHLRCHCLGWKSGYCWPFNECPVEGNHPWKCKCFGTSEFYNLTTCGKKPDADYH